MAEFIEGPPGPPGPKGDPGPPGPKGDNGVADFTGIEDHISNTTENPNNSITCTSTSIEIKNNENIYSLDLATGIDGDALVITDNNIKLSSLNKISNIGTSISGIETCSVSCGDGTITLRNSSNTSYTLDLSGEEPYAPLVKMGDVIQFGLGLVNNVICDIALPEQYNAAKPNTLYFIYDPLISYDSSGAPIPP